MNNPISTALKSVFDAQKPKPTCRICSGFSWFIRFANLRESEQYNNGGLAASTRRELNLVLFFVDRDLEGAQELLVL